MSGSAPPAAASVPGSSNAGGDASTPCAAGPSDCPIAVSLAPGRAQAQVLRGTLTPAMPSRRYQFCIAAAASLRWTWNGAAVHLVLEDPRGQTQGPGLPDPVRLASPGCYRLGVSANTMADDSFGDFSLGLALDP